MIGFYVIECTSHGGYKMWMADIRCTLTDLEEQHCDGEECQPKHPGDLSEKVIRCCLGLHTPCQYMWGSAEMADIRCAFTYLAAHHCRGRQVLVPRREHRRGTRASPPPPPHCQRWRRRRGIRWAGRSRGFLHGGSSGRVHRSVGEQSQPKHLNVLQRKWSENACVCTRWSETLSLWQRRFLIESAQPYIQGNIGNILINTTCIECIFDIHIIQAWYS